jgi:hypothetical protein
VLLFDGAPRSWRVLRFDEVCRFKQNMVKVEPDLSYRELTLRLYGMGFEVRRVVEGTRITFDEMQLLNEGDLVTSIHQFRNGAVGIIHKCLSGSVLSKNFLVYEPDTAVVFPHFLLQALTARQVIQKLQVNSTGSATPIFPKKMIESLEVPLPPLAEQRRIVARIEELAVRIKQVEDDGQVSRQAVDAVVASLASRLLNAAAERFGRRRLLDACDFEGGSQPPKRMFRYEPSPGYVRFLQIRDYSSDRYLTYIPESPRNSTVKEHEILVGRYGASLGKILRGKSGAYNVAMCKAVPKVDELTHDYLAICLTHGEFQQRLSEISRSAQVGFNKGDMADVTIPIPPIGEQRHIVGQLSALFAKVDDVKRVQAETQKELDALMPSILDRAFKGELV